MRAAWPAAGFSHLQTEGTSFSVRQRQFVVPDVSASTLPPDRLQTGLESPQQLVTLSSVEDDGLGEELNVLGELGPEARLIDLLSNRVSRSAGRCANAAPGASDESSDETGPMPTHLEEPRF